jgi:hypothetical protein
MDIFKKALQKNRERNQMRRPPERIPFIPEDLRRCPELVPMV